MYCCLNSSNMCRFLLLCPKSTDDYNPIDEIKDALRLILQCELDNVQ